MENRGKLANQRKIYRRWFYATLIAGMLFSNPAKAAVINYNEASSGDLLGSPENSHAFDSVFDLDIGRNTFTGQVTFNNVDPDVFNSDFDTFAFNIPANTRLESILLNISLLPGSSSIFNMTGYDLQNSSLNSIAPEQQISIPSTNVSLFASNLPLGSGKFRLRNNSFGGGIKFGEFRTAAYTLSLNVIAATPVPEPSLMFSTLTSIVFMVSFQLKRKQKIK